MSILRIGNKVIDRSRIWRRIDEMLAARAQGKSQQEVADALDVDRSFVSRLEALGEMIRGESIALVGFPVANKEELQEVARGEGIDFVLLYSEKERLAYVSQTAGSDLANDMMQATADLKSYDAVIFIGSDKRIGLVEAVIGRRQVYGVEIGKSPLTEDVWVDPDHITALVRGIRR